MELRTQLFEFGLPSEKRSERSGEVREKRGVGFRGAAFDMFPQRTRGGGGRRARIFRQGMFQVLVTLEGAFCLSLPRKADHQVLDRRLTVGVAL